MAYLVGWAAQNNNRLTANLGSTFAEGARKASDYLPDDDASLINSSSGGSPHASYDLAYTNWRAKNYTSSAMQYNGTRSAGLHKKYSHGHMWRYRKILKRTGKNRGSYNASTTLVT